MTRACRLVLLAVFAAALDARAGRPLSTEDASVLDARACQLEAWMDRSREHTDFWVAPACSFFAGWEFQAAAARSRADGVASHSQSLVQAKTVWRSVDEHPWGVGLSVGAVRHPRRDAATGWGDPYAIVPVSFRWGEGGLIHVNAGWSRNREERRNVTLWGIAFERPLGERLTLLGETYGENAGKPFFRLGGRYAAIKDRLDFDLTFVTRPGGTREERLVSLGLYVKTDAFLP